ncbi:hypothetical protein B4Q13_17440, partial [Lacticaseibacillus rhamnosus]
MPGQDGDDERKERLEQVVPVIDRGEADREDADYNEEADELLAEQPGGPRIFAVTEETQQRDAEDRPGGAEKDRPGQQRRNHQPGTVTLPKFLSFGCTEFAAPARQHDQQRRQDQHADD